MNEGLHNILRRGLALRVLETEGIARVANRMCLVANVKGTD